MGSGRGQWEMDIADLQKSQRLTQLTLSDLVDSHELVWKSCLVDGIPSLIPTLKAKQYPEHVQGRLSVIVVRADGLAKPTLSTSIRPYVVLEVGNMELRSTKKKANSTGGATWNEIFEFPVDFDSDEAPKDNSDYLIVNVFHKYYRLGRCLIAIKELSAIFHPGRKYNLPPISINDVAPIISREESYSASNSSWYPLGKNEFLTESAGFIQLEFSFAPGVEEEPHLVRWQPDTDLVACPLCNNRFTLFVRKHHCRKCGSLVCNDCSQGRMIITRNNANARKRNESGTKAVRVCDSCEPNKSLRMLMEKERAAEQLARIRKLSSWEPVDKTRVTPTASEEEDSDEKSPNPAAGRSAREPLPLPGGSAFALDLDSNREAYICECGRMCTMDSETNLRDFAARMRDTGEMPPLPTGSPRERWAWVASVMGLGSSRISLPEPPSESPDISRNSAERKIDVSSPPPPRSPAKRKPTMVQLNFGQICVCGRVILSSTRVSNRLSMLPPATRSRSIFASPGLASCSPSVASPLSGSLSTVSFTPITGSPSSLPAHLSMSRPRTPEKPNTSSSSSSSSSLGPTLSSSSSSSSNSSSSAFTTSSASTTPQRGKRATTVSPAPRQDRSCSGRCSESSGLSELSKTPPPPPSALVEAGSHKAALRPLRPAKAHDENISQEPLRPKKGVYATVGATPVGHHSSPSGFARHSKKQSLPPEPDGGPEKLGNFRRESEQVLPPSWSPVDTKGTKR